MADFCKQCSIEIFGEDNKDFVYQRDADLPLGMGWAVLCEGCGMTCVDDDGICINDHCNKHGNLLPNPSREEMIDIQNGEYKDNDIMNTICVRRLVNICDSIDDSEEAKKLITKACKIIKVTI